MRFMQPAINSGQYSILWAIRPDTDELTLSLKETDALDDCNLAPTHIVGANTWPEFGSFIFIVSKIQVNGR